MFTTLLCNFLFFNSHQQLRLLATNVDNDVWYLRVKNSKPIPGIETGTPGLEISDTSKFPIKGPTM